MCRAASAQMRWHADGGREFLLSGQCLRTVNGRVVSGEWLDLVTLGLLEAHLGKKPFRTYLV